ncbi:MAG: hypothetical protein IJT01_01300, partial [Selenomonadaceae bacterium]|nr:hypothetical protein [Selenomonadaceae bacterium]
MEEKQEYGLVLYLLDNWAKFSSHGTINPYRDGGIVLWDEKQVSLFFLMWIVDIWKARHVLARFKH